LFCGESVKEAEEMVTGTAIIAASGALVAAVAFRSAPDATTRIVELRQYTLHDGRRDGLVDLFEREFVESQEATGMKVIGTFTDLDRPNRFVWLRGFTDMQTRAAALTAFYTGPVWRAHRDAANATMIDSDNVLLLRPVSAGAALPAQPSRPPIGEVGPSGLIIAAIHYLKAAPGTAVDLFTRLIRRRLSAAGAPPIAVFVPETSPNSFPALPVREGERVLVWFARFDSSDDHAAAKGAITEALAPLAPLLERPDEMLRLAPTGRSELR
jgi:hypothetical protein